MKRERLQEGWVIFTKVHCKEGWIDRWFGDSINNPNNPTKHSMQLNSSACYWMCNNGDWVSDRDIGRSYIDSLLNLQMGSEFTAKEIWDELLRRYGK